MMVFVFSTFSYCNTIASASVDRRRPSHLASSGTCAYCILWSSEPDTVSEILLAVLLSTPALQRPPGYTHLARGAMPVAN